VQLLEHPSAPWASLRGLPFLILVGVTGVGKTTALEAMRTAGIAYSELPDRRTITDVVMIDALAGQPVHDREERFALTRQYRETHPGGMAEAIGALSVNLEHKPLPVVFDGLRGLDEVQYAARNYAQARFIVLDAPDTVRVQRLLGRNDAFDQMRREGNASAGVLEQLAGIKGVHSVFSERQIAQIAALEGVTADDLVAKTRIVVTERLNYDPVAAREYLLGLPGDRVLYVDTTAHPPLKIAARIREWL
jgi:predicted kinase